MTAAVWVTDTTSVTALGRNLEELWRRLLSGHSAIAPVKRFSVKGYRSRFAACIEDLRCMGDFSAFHDLLTRLFNQMGPVPTDARLYTATTKSGIDNLERMGRNEPAHASDVLLTAVAKQVRGRFGLADVGTNISAACASSAIAVAKGGGVDCRRARGMRSGLLHRPGHGICFFRIFRPWGALTETVHAL